MKRTPRRKTSSSGVSLSTLGHAKEIVYKHFDGRLMRHKFNAGVRVGVTPDGAIGPLTIRALQISVGARQDGARHLSATTVAALQTYLNAH